jgi:hypothetical protein
MATVEMRLVKRPKNIQNDIPQDIYVREYSRGIAESLVLMRGEFVQESPVGGTAVLRNSWQTNGPDVRGDVISGDVTSAVVQAIVVDQGAKPHTPPSGDSSGLKQWVTRKLRITDPTRASTVAFLISRKLKKTGLPKRKTFTNSFNDLKKDFDKAMVRAQKRMGDRLTE